MNWDFTTSDYGFTPIYGTYSSGVGFVGTAAGTGVAIAFTIPISSAGNLDFGCAQIEVLAGGGSANIYVANDTNNIINLVNQGDGFHGGSLTSFSLNVGAGIAVNPSSGASQGAHVTLKSLQLRGSGANPFGTSNCDDSLECS